MVLKRRISLKKNKAIYIGETIKRLREKIGISQEELAHRSKLNRSYLSDLETNKKQPSLYTFFALAKGLGIDQEKLLMEVKQSIDFDRIFGENLE
jgi:transcriptional regulator with XRE-family HTH domain